MNRPSVSKKFDTKTKKTSLYNQLDEEGLSFREIKNERSKKHYRNYDNALRSKDLSKLLSYEEDDHDT
jgi:hypothetical protein